MFACVCLVQCLVQCWHLQVDARRSRSLNLRTDAMPSHSLTSGSVISRTVRVGQNHTSLDARIYIRIPKSHVWSWPTLRI